MDLSMLWVVVVGAGLGSRSFDRGYDMISWIVETQTGKNCHKVMSHCLRLWLRIEGAGSDIRMVGKIKPKVMAIAIPMIFGTSTRKLVIFLEEIRGDVER